MARHISVRSCVCGCHFEARRWFDSQLLFGRDVELAVYACADECKKCNP